MPELAVGSAIADISNLTQEFLREKAAVPSAVLRDGYNPRRIVTKKLQSKFTRFLPIRQVFVSKKIKKQNFLKMLLADIQDIVSFFVK